MSMRSKFYYGMHYIVVDIFLCLHFVEYLTKIIFILLLVLEYTDITLA